MISKEASKGGAYPVLEMELSSSPPRIWMRQVAAARYKWAIPALVLVGMDLLFQMERVHNKGRYERTC